MYLSMLTLTTGHITRSQRAEVSDAEMDDVVAWMGPIINSGEEHALMAPYDDRAAKVIVIDGALVVTVYGKAPQVGRRWPLVTFGVARRSRHAGRLWQELTNPVLGPVTPGLVMPGVPWIAAHVHQSAASDRDAVRWLAKFERRVAWAWIARNAGAEAV